MQTRKHRFGVAAAAAAMTAATLTTVGGTPATASAAYPVSRARKYAHRFTSWSPVCVTT